MERRELRCRVYPLNALGTYEYTVICSRYGGKWVLSRHRERDTWETQGGHIEAGETPMEAAKRELFEESGIRDAELYPVCDYCGFNARHSANGMVFLAVVHSVGELPESEMQEIGFFEELPEDLTYPLTSPVLYREAEKVLAAQVYFVPATESNVMTILELRKTIWASTYRGIYPDSMIDDFDVAWHREKELQRIRHPDYRVYLIARGDRPVGYLITRKGEEVLLQSLYILEEYQHRGIGRRAFDFVRQYCAEIGTDSFICHCVPENRKARAFYERMGGIVIGADMDNVESWMNSVIYRFDVNVKGKAMNENLLGKCGFYCGCCSTYRNGGCKGCLEEHQTGDCFTRDCVLTQGIDCCGACERFPCGTILTMPRTTVLDKDWLRWKKESNTNR